ncbi:unnamed protein product [Chrysoparadoxa australica]
MDGNASSGWDSARQCVKLLLRNRDTLAQMRLQERINKELVVNATPSDGSQEAPLKVFVGGDRSKVGKSSVCLGLLGSLLKLGYKPSELAYIKPATQCELPQLVTAWCVAKGISCVGIGPIVFYRGFTREFLKGNAGTSIDLLNAASDAVAKLSMGKKVVIVDGVGYPAVGSICGVSNAQVAKTLEIPVLLVGKSGVGDAVDSFNLNETFFNAHGVTVLGALFNRLPAEGFYSLENCKASVSLYFSRNGLSQPYGFVPETPGLGEAMAKAQDEAREGREGEHNQQETETEGDMVNKERERTADDFIEMFSSHVDVNRLLADAREASKASSASGTAAAAAAAATVIAPVKPPASGGSTAMTREEIEKQAELAGASGG